MSDYSIELAAEQIVDPRSKDYFREVYSSYVNGNFRSAVVMLWSTVICDLLFKLEDLKGRADPAAVSISTEVETKQKASPNSPEWELLLVDLVKEKTYLLDVAEHLNITTLQKHRHLSAHPVLTGTYALFSPNRETTRAHMRNALEAVLTKPAFMSKKVFDTFTEDLERLGQVILYGDDPDDPDLRRYLDATYFQRLSPTAAESLFRSMWRLVFKKEDARCESNRAINFRALRLLYRKYAAVFLERAKTEPAYYSDVAVAGTPLRALVAFLFDNPAFLTLLTDAARIPLKRHIDADMDQRASAWFMAADLNAHLDDLLQRRRAAVFDITSETFERLYKLAKREGLHGKLLEFAVLHYTTSGSFNAADARFRDLIKPHLEDMSAAVLTALLGGIEQNNQVHGRGRASIDHPLIKSACDRALGAGFDYTAYPNFMASLA